MLALGSMKVFHDNGKFKLGTRETNGNSSHMRKFFDVNCIAESSFAFDVGKFAKYFCHQRKSCIARLMRCAVGEFTDVFARHVTLPNCLPWSNQTLRRGKMLEKFPLRRDLQLNWLESLSSSWARWKENLNFVAKKLWLGEDFCQRDFSAAAKELFVCANVFWDSISSLNKWIESVGSESHLLPC